MKDKKAAKKIIKIAKQHPNLYSQSDVEYARMIKKRLKYAKQQKRKIGSDDPRSREDDGVHSESKQPEESGQPRSSWFTKILHKARSLVGF